MEDNILSYEEELKQKALEKIREEYKEFIKELKQNRPEVIIERAYEKVCKEEMIYAFEKKELTVSECKAIIGQNDVLSLCYDNWLNSDGNFNEMLEYSVDDELEKIEKDYKLEQKNKNKNVR